MRSLLVAVALLLATGSASAQSLKPFKYGVSSVSVSVFPAFVADSHKLFEKHGLKVEIISMEGGTRGLQILLSGEIQATSVGLGPMAQANSRGANLRMVASTAKTIPITFLANPRIKGPQDVKGATFGISTFGAETDISISLALKKWGMSRNDVVITQVGGTVQRYNALVASRIDVAPLLEPSIALARQKGGFTELIDLAAENTPWVFDGIAMTTDTLKSDPDLVQRFIKGYLEAAHLAFGDAEKAKQVISVRWRTKDPVVIDATYASFLQIMPRDGAPTLDGARNVFEQFEALGTKLASHKLEDHIDFGHLEAIHKSGFMDELKQRYGAR